MMPLLMFWVGHRLIIMMVAMIVTVMLARIAISVTFETIFLAKVYQLFISPPILSWESDVKEVCLCCWFV